MEGLPRKDSKGTCFFPRSSLTTAVGTLNGKEVRVLRDTGCTGVVVRRSLVSDGQMLNKQSGVTLINNYKQRCPVAHINIDCPSLEVLRMHCALRIETKFIRRNGLIYRHFKKNAKVTLQLVVPSSLTHSVMN